MELLIMNFYYTYLLIDPRNNQPFYVGKGKGRRMYQHVLDCNNRNQDYTNDLQNRIREIRKDGFKIIYDKVLINVTKTSSHNKERDLIEEFGRVDLGTGCLLNRTTGGQEVSLISDKTREIKRQGSSKPVDQYTLDGEFIKSYPSAKVAGEETSANRSYITQCCKGKQKSAGGFLWVYKDAPAPTYEKKYYSPVQQLTIKGKIVAEFRSLTEAQAVTGVELHNISECCRGKSRIAGGFMWQYK